MSPMSSTGDSPQEARVESQTKDDFVKTNISGTRLSRSQVQEMRGVYIHKHDFGVRNGPCSKTASACRMDGRVSRARPEEHIGATEVAAEDMRARPTADRDRRWKFLPRLDPVYDSSKAVRELGWKPVYSFERALIEKAEEWRSELRITVARKSYNKEPTGVYTTK
ncbi:hypothetical protein V1520DRAFT_378919 [Lipomyces starkeyi]